MPILLRPWSWPPSSPFNQVPDLLQQVIGSRTRNHEYKARTQYKMQKDKFSVPEKSWNTCNAFLLIGDSNTCVAWEKGQWQWLIMVLWNNWAAEYKCDKIKYKVWYRIHQVPLVSNLDVLKIIPSALMWSEILWFFNFLSKTIYEQVITTQSNTFQVGNMVCRKKGGNMG